jgi:hypothetical protein
MKTMLALARKEKIGYNCPEAILESKSANRLE